MVPWCCQQKRYRSSGLANATGSRVGGVFGPVVRRGDGVGMSVRWGAGGGECLVKGGPRFQISLSS